MDIIKPNLSPSEHNANDVIGVSNMPMGFVERY